MAEEQVKLKGNACEMGQGGVKPDDWLLRILPNGRWYRVTFSTWDDRRVKEWLLSRVVTRPHWYDMANYVRDHPRVPVVSAVQFARKVGLEEYLLETNVGWPPQEVESVE